MHVGEPDASSGSSRGEGQQLVRWLYEDLGWSDGRIALEVRKAAVELRLYPRLDNSNRGRPDHVTVYRWRHGLSSPMRFYMRLLRHVVEMRRRDFLIGGAVLVSAGPGTWSAQVDGQEPS